jgi:hypothetical protein
VLLGFLSAKNDPTLQWLRPVLVLGVFAVVQMTESMFITPRVQSHSTGLHPLAIILGILFWSMLLPGLLGPIVAVPLTCAVVVLLRRYVWQEKSEGRPGFPKRPSLFGRKPNSVPARLLKAHRRWSFIFRRISPAGRRLRDAHATDTRDGPRTFLRDRAGDPASLFGLAPHGVYRAPEVALRAVGFYPAFSPLPRRPFERARGGLFSVTLSIGRSFRPGPPRVFPRHAALWCSDFPLPPKRERPSTRAWPVLLWALFLPLRAQNDGRNEQDGPIKMTPDLALAIPLQMKGKHDVMVKFPILINPSTVVRPGMILRVLYQPPMQSDSENLVLAHKGNMENTYARATSSEDSSQAKLPPEIAHALEGYRRTVWEVPINFQLALAQLPTDNLHLIYSTSGSDNDLDDERLIFFDGLFLGSPSGGTSVLAVGNRQQGRSGRVQGGRPDSLRRRRAGAGRPGRLSGPVGGGEGESET